MGVAIAAIGISCLNCHWESSSLPLERTVDCFSHLAVCIIISNTMKAIPQEGELQDNSNSGQSSPVS